MKKISVFLVAMFATGSLLADTIELADGRLLEGDFVGSSNGIIMFDTGEGIEAFPEAEVVGMWFSSGVATREAEMTQTGPAPTLSVPAGTRLVVRMSDSVDSSRHGAGHRFRGQLESAVVVDGVTVLVDQLRRRGCSVDALLNASPNEIAARLKSGHHHALMMSVACFPSLDLATKAIKVIRQIEGVHAPILLGGAILDYASGLQETTGADLVTKDIDIALGAIESRQANMQVAE